LSDVSPVKRTEELAIDRGKAMGAIHFKFTLHEFSVVRTGADQGSSAVGRSAALRCHC